MLSLQQWSAFLALAVFLILLPGADTALVVRTTLQHGRRTGLWVGVGICSGLLVWGAATALGLAALFQSSTTAHDLLSVAGAGYLMYLGARALLDRANGLNDQVRPSRSIFLTGFLANLLNPKVAVFYLSVFAQFITPGSTAVLQGLTLAGVHFALSMVWFAILTRLLTRVLSPAWRRAISLISGTALILFGLGLLLPVVSS